MFISKHRFRRVVERRLDQVGQRPLVDIAQALEIEAALAQFVLAETFEDRSDSIESARDVQRDTGRARRWAGACSHSFVE